MRRRDGFVVVQPFEEVFSPFFLLKYTFIDVRSALRRGRYTVGPHHIRRTSSDKQKAPLQVL